MASPLIEKFKTTLKHLEETGDSAPLLELFSEGCELISFGLSKITGKPAAQRFWRDYLSQFQRIQTDFQRTLETTDTAFLEWISKGRFRTGFPLAYEGLTVLEIRNGRICRLRAYYGRHPEHVGHPVSTSQVMEGGPRRDVSTPGEGVLTSTMNDRDAATG